MSKPTMLRALIESSLRSSGVRGVVTPSLSKAIGEGLGEWLLNPSFVSVDGLVVGGLVGVGVGKGELELDRLVCESVMSLAFQGENILGIGKESLIKGLVGGIVSVPYPLVGALSVGSGVFSGSVGLALEEGLHGLIRGKFIREGLEDINEDFLGGLVKGLVGCYKSSIVRGNVIGTPSVPSVPVSGIPFKLLIL